MVGEKDHWTDASVSERSLVVPSIDETLLEAGLEPIGEYISCCHTIVTQCITMRPIFDLVVAEERQPISLATVLWW